MAEWQAKWQKGGSTRPRRCTLIPYPSRTLRLDISSELMRSPLRPWGCSEHGPVGTRPTPTLARAGGLRGRSPSRDFSRQALVPGAKPHACPEYSSSLTPQRTSARLQAQPNTIQSDVGNWPASRHGNPSAGCHTSPRTMERESAPPIGRDRLIHLAG